MQEIKAGTKAASQLFRTLRPSRTRRGTWQVLLRQTGNSRVDVSVAAYVIRPRVRLQLQISKPSGKRALVRAKLTSSGRPVRGAKITAIVAGPNGKRRVVRLFDDGRHRDHRRGDGLYANTAGVSAATDTVLLVTARARGKGTLITSGVSPQGACGNAR